MKTAHPTRPPPKTKPGAKLLGIEGLAVSYGGIRALKGIALEVARGEIVAMIGANGAGKTTTLKTIMKLLPIAAGKVVYDGTDLADHATEDVVDAGMALVPEGRAIFPDLTVHENLELGAYNHKDRQLIAESVDDVVGLFPRLGERMRQEGGTLSGGEQQMLAIARAMMLEPKIILLDEPTEGLMPRMVTQIHQIIDALHNEGVAILLVEQNVPLTLEASQRIYIMEKGAVRHHCAASELKVDDAVVHQYLGV